VVPPLSFVTPSPGQARDGSAYDNVSCASCGAVKPVPGSRHFLLGPYCPRLRFRPWTAESGCQLGAPPFSPAEEGLAFLRRQSDADFMRRLSAQPGNRGHSLGHGDGQRPEPGTSRCSRLDAVALSLITAGQRDAAISDPSRRAWRQPTGKTSYHLASLLILKSRIEIKTEKPR
jgi:hypothetical protein